MTQIPVNTNIKYFIETGTGEWGFTLVGAVHSHFDTIYSIELSYPYYQKWASAVASINSRVHMLHGNSAEIFPKLISQIPHTMMLCLNAHYTAKPDAKGDTYTSLWEELQAIQEHPIKNHTIMIPEIELCGTMRFDFITLDTVISKIKKINNDYKILYTTGRDDSKILIAQAV